MAILALFVPLASAQEPSPAGGGFVSFTDNGSYAIALDDEALDEKLDTFMIEAWIYVTEYPKAFGTAWPDVNQIIAAKPGSYELAKFGGRTDMVRTYRELVTQNPQGRGSVSGVWDLGVDFTFDRWYHIGVGFSGSPSIGAFLFDGMAYFCKGPPWWNGHAIFDSDSSLYIGGIERDAEHAKDESFPGFIDEVRISDVLRYIDIPDLPKLWQADDVICIEYDPPGRFKNDEHTRGLWHFDDGEGETEFMDSSGNNNTLIGEDGAAIVSAFAVESSSKLLITWGKIKSKY
jgi:hypothetical protein